MSGPDDVTAYETESATKPLHLGAAKASGVYEAFETAFLGPEATGRRQQAENRANELALAEHDRAMRAIQISKKADVDRHEHEVRMRRETERQARARTWEQRIAAGLLLLVGVEVLVLLPVLLLLLRSVWS